MNPSVSPRASADAAQASAEQERQDGAPARIRRLHSRRAVRRTGEQRRERPRARRAGASGNARPMPPPLPASAPATASARAASASARTEPALDADLPRLPVAASRHARRWGAPAAATAAASRPSGPRRFSACAVLAPRTSRGVGGRRPPRSAGPAWPPPAAGRSPPAAGTTSRYSWTPELPGGATTCAPERTRDRRSNRRRAGQRKTTMTRSTRTYTAHPRAG